MTPVTIAGKVLYFLVANTDMDNDTKYYGYLERGNTWYIMREVTSTGIFTYALGTNGYATAWTNRDSQIYLSISAVF